MLAESFEINLDRLQIKHALLPTTDHEQRTHPKKPEGPRSDSRRHRVGLLICFLRSACASGIGPILRQVALGLGPPRPVQQKSVPCVTLFYRRFPALDCAGARPTGRHGGFPTGRPWVFASTITLAFLLEQLSFPDPFLGSAASSPAITDTLKPLGPMPQLSRTLSRQSLSTTGGDLNPTCHTAFSSRLVAGGPIAGRRPRPCPQLVASHGAYL